MSRTNPQDQVLNVKKF